MTLNTLNDLISSSEIVFKKVVLRSNDDDQNNAANVNFDGDFTFYGSYVLNGFNAVRVAMWVEFKSNKNLSKFTVTIPKSA